MLTKKLAKMGNSLGAIIPKDVRDLLDWDKDVEIEYHVKGSELILKPATSEPKPLIDVLDLNEAPDLFGAQ